MVSEFDPKKVHLIERDDLHILFCKDTLEFYNIDCEDADMARPFIIENSKYVDEDDIQTLKNQNILNILQFNISEDCNLNCAYCAAEGGTYGRKAGKISPETALKGLEIILSHYEGINNIQFFGGEPLLNLKAIKVIVEYLHQYKEDHPDFSMPKFNINTNGTILNDEIIAFLKKYPSVMIVISLDGPEIIHNRFRKNRSGKGTFQQIVNNINLLYQETGQPVGIEMVYGTHFLEAGVSLRSALEHLESLLPPNKHTIFAAPLVVNDISPTEVKKYHGYHPDLIPDYIEMIQLGFAEFRQGKTPIFSSKVTSTVKTLLNKKTSKHFCIPSKTKLMIDAQGNFVPCNAFVNRPDYHIGHISDPESFKNNIGKFEDIFLAKRKTTYYKECAHCWAFHLCTFCMSHIFKGEKPEMDEIDPNLCETHQAITEEIVLQLGSLAKDPELWQRFKSYIQSSA